MRTLHPIVKAILGAAIGFVVFAALSSSIQSVYYKVMPGSYWLDYYYVHVDNAEIGQNVPITLCRRTHYSDFQLDATRTFIRQQTNGSFQTVSEYNLTPRVESRERPCQTIQILAKRQPQVPGVYQVCTTAAFYVEGNRKSIPEYCSNSYQINAPSESLEAELQRLQLRVAEVEKLLAARSRP